MGDVTVGDQGQVRRLAPGTGQVLAEGRLDGGGIGDLLAGVTGDYVIFQGAGGATNTMANAILGLRLTPSTAGSSGK